MTTRTENEVRIFNEAINKCRMPVFLISSDGTEYNMKSADQNKAGMARWVKDSNNEMEIYTCDLEDEMIMPHPCASSRSVYSSSRDCTHDEASFPFYACILRLKTRVLRDEE